MASCSRSPARESSNANFRRNFTRPFWPTGHRAVSGTVTVRFSDAIVAATERAKVLREDGHEPVFYVPV